VRQPENWPKRGRNEHLTFEEIAMMRLAYNASRDVREVAREFRCSVRIAQKYYSQFAGRCAGAPRTSIGERHKLPPPPPRPPVDRASRFCKSNFEPS